MASAEAKRFFYEHAGYSHNPATETEEQGRVSGAANLARAEERMQAGPYFVEVDPDSEPYDGDGPWDGPVWVVTLYSVSGSTESTPIGSVGNVACEDGDPYLRVVAAELALEHIEEYDTEYHPGRD